MKNAPFFGMIMPISLMFAQTAHALTCAQVREKAKPKKTAKAECTLLEHTAGYVERGEAVSIYQCGKTKYTLTTQEDDSCTLSSK